MEDLRLFRQDLLAWYSASKRPLPWRQTKNPYAILVSELMLQQTQVKTVIPYYERFLKAFPSEAALAKADEAHLLKLWEGLGYYRRARHLQQAAQQICEQHDGVFPRDKKAIDQLKGVGPYTSAAVASIAFELPHACVDGNVIRVISRLAAMDDDVSKEAVKKEIATKAQTYLDEAHAGDFNQAMMELGATICSPKKPSCMACPVATHCQTNKRGDQPELRPFKSKRIQPSKIALESILLFSNQKLLLARRPDEGLMASMWELPTQDQTVFMPWEQILADEPQFLGRLPKPLVHRFTHLHATYHVSVFRSEQEIDWLKQPNAYSETRWIGLSDFSVLPITKVLHKLLPQLTEYLKGNQPCQRKPSVLPGMQAIN